ncbi:hypothetical protein JOY44_24510 (plasmid) [Phormidium sp. CLA17]|uniref:hypothetical protein n=1 Tax=Leptolyngbya sp. Cla-17 TaxID=2803751 RepID=UPI0014923845|nr:hypothetical protein [Leptolyngbya sp. Cla-17]MBM0744724.1 hypothetical protein [Leptolyngbya sp. Cla-17]
MAHLPLDLDCNVPQWQCSAPLDADIAAHIRRAMMLQGFKWDTQVGDVNTLAPFALILPSSDLATTCSIGGVSDPGNTSGGG